MTSGYFCTKALEWVGPLTTNALPSLFGDEIGRAGTLRMSTVDCCLRSGFDISKGDEFGTNPFITSAGIHIDIKRLAADRSQSFSLAYLECRGLGRSDIGK